MNSEASTFFQEKLSAPLAAIGVIPARYGSQRLPGKPLLRTGGKTLLQHTWENSLRFGCDQLFILTDDDRVIQEALSFGAQAIKTPKEARHGTERIAYAVAHGWLPRAELVINIQGDEPHLPPHVPQKLIQELHRHRSPQGAIATAVAPMGSLEEAERPSVVKCVRDRAGRALYFSREMIPHWRRDNSSVAPTYWRHLGVYGYQWEFLEHFLELEPTPLEQSEGLEQLLFLEHGYTIWTVEVETTGMGIDTPEDWEVFKALCIANISSSQGASAPL